MGIGSLLPSCIVSDEQPILKIVNLKFFIKVLASLWRGHSLTYPWCRHPHPQQGLDHDAPVWNGAGSEAGAKLNAYGGKCSYTCGGALKS